MKKIILVLLIIQCSLQLSYSQWIAQNSGTNENLYDIEFINDQTGWAVGDAGVVIKTTNGGTNWVNVQNPSGQLSPNLWTVVPIDSSIIYVTSGQDFAMKTINGGMNWNVIHHCPNCNSSFIGAYFLNKDTGWFLGAYKVFRTYNGGLTLDSFSTPWFDIYEIYFKDINTGVFCGDGRVFKSTNGGESWFNTNVPVGGSFPMFRKLGVYGDNLWVGGGNPKIYKSTNFGESWSISDSSLGAFGIDFISSNTGFIGGGLNALYKTTNGGTNFYRQRTDSLSLAFISSISFVNESTGWYSCAVGRIYKTTSGGEWITDILSSNEEFPNSFRLDQNYPNPFNAQTKINFYITKIDNYSLEVYDTRGVRIQEIFNKSLDPGKYNFIYNAKSLSSGVYFYRLTGVNITETRRMILVK